MVGQPIGSSLTMLSSTSSGSTHVFGGGGGLVVSLAGACISGGSGVIGGVKQSGHGVGAMREPSLVALGGGGVLVQRLEAYEMASMWDAQDGEGA
jgi:hypothetical protein